MIDERPPQLDAYRRKRDPDRTPEPFGSGRPGTGGLFVVQQHAARRLHYDLRLEMDGVLKSWAVPKGPSVRPEVKRLAVHVEDHPLEYAEFEGVIPKDNYGAGAVIVWDHGRYRSAKPEDPRAQLERGLLEVEFRGHKLRGQWTLARMGGKEGQGKDWLLIRKAGEPVPAEEITERYPRSVRSGLTLEEMRDAGAVREALRGRLRDLGAPAREVPVRKQGVMLATPGTRPPEGADWLFEIKHDGVRVLAERAGDTVTLVGRSGQVVTGRYPEIVSALRALAFDHVVIDGEIVALDARGVSSFQRLQARMGLTRPGDVARMLGDVPVEAVFFDCLALEGHDLRRLPLEARKACLERVLPPLGVARYGAHVGADGPGFLEAATDARLEGIVAKRRASTYVARRSDAWVKIKCQRRLEFVIGGYTDPQGGRAHFGALHLGLHDGERLVYVSKVGTGFDGPELARLWQKLQPLRRDTAPFATGTPVGRGHHWVEPRLVAEVRFTEWTRGGGIRHPIYLGLRDDVRPEDCRRESSAGTWDRPVDSGEPARDEGRAAASGPADAPRDAGVASASRVRLTNLDKVFWPAEGYTKGDLIRYYDAIAPVMLPYLRDRPIVLTRYPDGIAGKSFFQKDAPEFAPDWMRTERVYSKDTDREIDYFVLDDAEMLRYVANMGTIPIHAWNARAPALERPDWLVLDLDPKGAPFADVVRVAQALHRLLDDLELPGYVKTSGATGLHILVPLGARYTHEQTRTLARLLAMLVVQAVPDIATVARPLAARGGKVYVDFGQNGHGQTIVAPFSVRPLRGAPVSCPLDWGEVTARLDPARFTIRTAPRRFVGRADPLEPVLAAGIDLAAALARMEGQLEIRTVPGPRARRARSGGAASPAPEAP